MLSSFLGQNQPKLQDAGATISKLCDKLENSTQLEDRRAAVFGLKGFARAYRESVAAQGLKALIATFHRDKEDAESCRATLETFIILFGPQIDEGSQRRMRHKQYPSLLKRKVDGLRLSEEADYIGLWLSDELTQDNTRVSLILSLIQSSSDLFIKLYSLQVLSALISFRPNKTREAICADPLGVSLLVSCLDDISDIVRNEAIVVLLHLVENHMDMQKVVVFQGTFEKIFNIIDAEAGLSGGAIVEDCLLLLATLIKFNVSNQNHFREVGCMHRIAALLEDAFKILSGSNSDDDSNPISRFSTSLSICLQLCRLFVVDERLSRGENQVALSKSGVQLHVLKLAFSPNLSWNLRAAALLTVGDIIRRNSSLQQDFLHTDVPYQDLNAGHNDMNQEIIPVSQALLNWALLSNSVHAFDLRVASQECLASSFEGNNDAKMQFLREQIQCRIDVNERLATSIGGHANIIAALVDYDPEIRLNPYKTWFAAEILLNMFADDDSHEVVDYLNNVIIELGDDDTDEDDVHKPDDKDDLDGNVAEKKQDEVEQESAADSESKTSVSDDFNDDSDEEEQENSMPIIRAIADMLTAYIGYGDSRITLAYLQLLSVWMFDNVKSVNQFLEASLTVQALVQYVLHPKSTDSSLVEPLAYMLLGITYDFSGHDSPMPRADLHRLFKSTFGRDQYVLGVKKLRELSEFKEFDKERHLLDYERDQSGLPKVYLDSTFVELIKENFGRIVRSIDRDPLAEPSSRVSLEQYEDLLADYTDTSKQLEHANQEVNDLRVSLEECQRQLMNAEEKEKDMVNSLSTKEQQLTAVSAELSELHHSHTRLSEAHTKSQRQLASQDQSLSEFQNREKQLKTQLDKALKGKEQAENGVNKMNRDLMELSRNKEQLEKDIAQREKQRKKDEDESNKLIKQMNVLKQQLKDVEGVRDQVIDRLRSAAEEIETLKRQTSSMVSKDKFEAINTKLASMVPKAELIALQSQFEGLKAQNETQQTSLTNAQKQIETMVSREELTNSIDKLNAAEAELAEMISKEQMEEKLSVMVPNSELQLAKDELEELKKEKELLHSKVEKLDAQLAATVDLSEYQRLEMEIKNLIPAEQHKLLQEELDKTKATMKNQAKLDKELTILKEKVESMVPADDMQTLQLELSSTKKHLEESRERIKEMEKTISESKEVSSPISDEKHDLSELPKLKSDYDQLVAEKKQIESQLSEMISKDKYVELQSQLQAEKRKLDDMVSKDELAKVRAEADAAVSKITSGTLPAKSQDMVPRSELDDLLLVLSDIEASKALYKDKLKDLGQEVSDDDDDDDDDEEEDEETDT